MTSRPDSIVQAVPPTFPDLRSRGEGERIPSAARCRMERLFEASFEDVRVFLGPEPKCIGARAFTLGDRIFFDPAAYDPMSAEGRLLLAHELTHVVQQRAGRVPSPDGGPPVIFEDAELEEEADETAALTALAGGARASLSRVPPVRNRIPDRGVLQLQKWGWIGQRVLAAGLESTHGKFDGLDSIDGPQASELCDAVSGEAKPADSDVVKYNSTATLNEVHSRRIEAWRRARELAVDLTGGALSFYPLRVYHVTDRANQAIPEGDRDTISSDPVSAAPGNSTQRVWVRYKPGVKPAAAEIGFYYEFGGLSKGGGLLIVEHTEDGEALLEVRKKNGTVETKATVAHFHVAFFDQGRYGSPYLEINPDGNTVDHGLVQINETRPLAGRRGYEIKLVPSHHIYYLD